MILTNETNLHYAVVRYIRDNHTDAVIVHGLGEYQDTGSRRCDAWRKGYKGGQPDLILANPMNGYTGFAIELKSPKGTGIISENQMTWLNLLRKRGYMTLISDNYAKPVIQLNEYFKPDNRQA
ncbi:VRR-NUC domain-containing [Paramuricea clavata]|uniref:VRR-NUC domain-containing n=1 Tax=Paramuricea clavata TaxID=317549 RepID=A0A7D9HIS3_PARCT|nr:VRR-NUC domain-containing [Paramuricea clavata]